MNLDDRVLKGVSADLRSPTAGRSPSHLCEHILPKFPLVVNTSSLNAAKRPYKIKTSPGRT
ncbi:MAG: hypothetical protein HWQ44_10795 [Nostoc sp. JL34]|uniref:hypothetical protein n=1 Tax=unclassified Nostoc TaxID=2593658 RepID=UPI0015C3445C|nr:MULTISPECIES: hypothetical protein [unclassified Nostoc]MBN3883441.1 hypothetical protein [Nostoc sp. JL34]QLE52870.1 hypothetical protein FD724_33455 [Nostoc sp. C057]